MTCTSLNLVVGFGVIIVEFLIAAFPKSTEEWATRFQTNPVVMYIKQKLGAVKSNDREKHFAGKTHWGGSRHSVRPLPDTDLDDDGREGPTQHFEIRPATSAGNAETTEDKGRKTAQNLRPVAMVEL